MQQSEFFAVDEVPFLAFFNPLDRQPDLFFKLIVGTVVEI